MLIRRTPEIHSSEITPERDYLNRREFMAAAGLIVGTGVLEASSPWGSWARGSYGKNASSSLPGVG